nr:rubredoxin [Nocardia mikamii]
MGVGAGRLVLPGLRGRPYRIFQCIQCGFEYDEEQGWPDEGIAPGTRWEDIPDDWTCPDCGAAKADFFMVEIERS